MRDGQKGMWLHESHMDTSFQSPIMLIINCESILYPHSPQLSKIHIVSGLIGLLLSLLNSVK